MKNTSGLAVLLMTGAFSLGAQTPTTEQMKSDLVGQTMGGRHECWKFQSTGQIKELKIKDKTENMKEHIYSVALQLEAMKDCGKYAAEARIEYTKTDAGWKIKQVGLLWLKKVD